MRKKGSTRAPELLKNAFWELYAQKDIEKIKISEITNLAGFNRSAFYTYFNNIYDVFSQIETDIMQEIVKITVYMHDFIIHDDFDKDKLEPVLDLYKKNEKYLKVLLTKNDNPRFMYRLKKILHENLYKNIIADNLTVEQKHLEYYVEYYISGFINIIIYWFTKGSNITEDEFSSIAKDVVNKSSASILKEILAK